MNKEKVLKAHVVWIGAWPSSKSEGNTRFILLIAARECYSCRLYSTITSDLEIKTVSVELRFPQNSNISPVAVKREKLCTENVRPSFDVAWKLKGVCVVVVDEHLITPLAYISRLVSTENSVGTSYYSRFSLSYPSSWILKNWTVWGACPFFHAPRY